MLVYLRIEHGRREIFLKFKHLPYSPTRTQIALNRDIEKKRRRKERGKEICNRVNSDKFTISPPFLAAGIIN